MAFISGNFRSSRAVSAQVRVRQYYEASNGEYYPLLDWQEVEGSGEQELEIPIDRERVASGGRTYVEWRFARRGGGKFDEKSLVSLEALAVDRTRWGWYTRTVLSCEQEDNYRFGFNGQEKVNEISGVGNHTTALFWEYDTRLGRRWNLDPVDQVSISNYSVNRLNPILWSDPLGDDPRFMLNPVTSSKNMASFAKGVGNTVIQTLGGLTQMWEHGKGNPNAMSLRDIGNGMVRGIAEPVHNFVNNPNAENLGSLVATGLLFKSFAKESNIAKSVPLEGGGKVSLSINNLNKSAAFLEKASVFDKSGNLKSEIQMRSRTLDVDMSTTKNKGLIDHLTKDGSQIGDWDKMAVNVLVKGADGKINTNMDIHYYQNRVNGNVDFGYDYKANLGSEYFKRQSAKPKEN